MPRWLLPDKEGYIYFTASKDLYKKFLGLAFGVVFQAKDGERPVEFCLESSVNGSMAKEIISTFRSSDLENVWLDYRERQQLWPDYRTTYDWSHFQFSIRVLSGGNVKKCGFRLICKPLDYDLEVLLQDDQSVDPALLYEIWHENDQANTEEESSSELEYLLDHKTGSEEYSTSNLVREGSNMADVSLQRCRYSRISPEYRIVRSGGEMPKEFVLVEDGTISFRASQDLYDKLFELDLCVAISVGEGKKEISFDIVPHVNGQRRNVLSGTLGSFDSDQVWIQFFKPNWLWGVLEGGVDFGQFEESYLRFSLRLRVLGGTLMKLGYFIRCRRLEDDLKVVLEDNQLVDPAALREDVDDEWGSFSGPYIPYVI
ncbi:uncharacterized protein LOC120286776 [Eucalyptus grandis]|uniref:uncharacterized protein LOC120286776 n=1 Tax=Eucalyptus grandis TaxID=71139 RepID=UPI00192EB360|nr:uncharacterized protein LOC120286776 [Eucalyptus grandis]